MSSDLAARALAITPTGRQTLSKGAYPVDPTPHVVRGQGCRLTLADGRELIDWVASLATVTLGHAHPSLINAIAAQLHDGGTFALPHALEVEVGEKLCALMGYEQVRWCSTGSEATEAAVRVARIATGRDVVLTHGYHSWFSTFTAARPMRPGVPETFRDVMIEWSTLDGLASRLSDQVAAVILEPAHFTKDEAAVIVALAHHGGALVIFDEVVSGLRVALRGAQELHDVKPDLSVYGKALSNGAFPVAALLGSREVMRHAWPCSGTYSGHPVGLAAVNAVLDIYEREPVIERIHAAGRAFIDGFNALGGVIRASGHPARPMLEGPDVARTTFHREAFARGVLLHPSGNNAMAAHSDADVSETLAICAAALKAIA